MAERSNIRNSGVPKNAQQTIYETHSKEVAFAYAKDGFVEVSNRYKTNKTIDRAIAHAVRRGIRV